MADVNDPITALLPDCATVARLLKSMSAEHTATSTMETKEASGEEPNLISVHRRPDSDGDDFIPAKPAVYACFAADGSPIIAATTANLRRALQNRLVQTVPKPVRLNYAEITETIRYRRVGSAFAASWWYYQTVRVLFPERYSAMLAWKAACFLTVNPEADFPRWKISSVLASAPAITAGPLPTSRSAATLVHDLEELFDLCRYYAILCKSPRGQACTYKELGQCPAPCDGSISMAVYRRQISIAADFAADTPGVRRQWMLNQEHLMRTAATAMDFHQAARLKRKLDHADRLCHGELAAVHNMEYWKYLILQRGKTRHWVAPFISGAGWLAALPEVKDRAAAAAVDSWMAVGSGKAPEPADVVRAPLEELAALVSYHQYRVHDGGLYIPITDDKTAETVRRSVQDWLAVHTDGEVLEVNSSVVTGTSASTTDDSPSNPAEVPP